jgi:hypothetical protein
LLTPRCVAISSSETHGSLLILDLMGRIPL